MKTPMQEMFDQLKASKKDEYGLAFAIDMLLENEQEMLEKEKEVMCKFAERYLDSIPKEHPSVEDVYNETFNTEEEMRADKEGYHLRTLRYYGDGGIVNEIHGFVKLIAIHGGGNYGLAEQYDIVNSEGRYKLQYYGDSSAKVTKYETFNTKEKCKTNL